MNEPNGIPATTVAALVCILHFFEDQCLSNRSHVDAIRNQRCPFRRRYHTDDSCRRYDFLSHLDGTAFNLKRLSFIGTCK